MKRVLLIAAAVVAAVVVAAMILLYSSLDAIVKAAIEKVGSDVTGTAVRLDSVKISPTTGEGTLRGFRVTNPRGFSEDDAFRFDEVRVTVDLKTLASDPVVIKEIVVEGPQINYHIGDRGTNIGTIQENVDSGGPTTDEESGPNLVIENLYLRDGEVNVSAGWLQGKKLGTPLPDVHLQGIGRGEDGATPGQVAREIFGALGRRVSAAVASLDLGAVKDTMAKGGKEAKEALGEAGGKAKKAVKKLLEKAKE